MKRIIAIVFTLTLLISASAHAGAAKMIFWYPGEAGSTEEAQGLLDELFEYLKKKNSKLDIKGKYFNTTGGGKSYIKKDKPSIGIISYPAYKMNKEVLTNASVILATVPLPQGATKVGYILIGPKKLADNGQTIYVSEPLTRAFITKNIAPGLPASLKIKQTQSMFSTLKKLASGELKGWALLTYSENWTLMKMKAPWTREVRKEYNAICQDIPSARVVVFGDYKQKDALISTLMGMQSCSEGKAILEELRLKGFARP